MGRGASSEEAGSVAGFRTPKVEGIDILMPEAPPDIGSEAHRQRLAEYARGRTARSDVSVDFNGACGACGHSYDEHVAPGGRCQTNGCGDGNGPCPKYIPNGQSFTDMHGHIEIQSDVPPQADPVERELCIQGFLRHEVCHELYTDRDVFDRFVEELKEKRNNKEEVTAGQLQQVWNILEDGMIENRERELMPGAFEYISAMNKIYPRVGRDEDTVVEHQYIARAPDGYVPEDADGKKLPVMKAKDLLSQNKYKLSDQDKMILASVDPNQKMVIVPAGTKLGIWGKAPMDLQGQAQSALLATSVPEFEAGELHPTVQTALDECRPHIEAATSGNSADCVARAYPVHAILRKHGLLRDDLTDEERQALEQLAQELGQIAPSMPQSDGQSGDGGPGQPASNGMPSPQPGQEQMSQGLSDQLSGGGGGGNGEPSDGDEQDGQGGGAGDQEEDGKDGEKEGQGDGKGDKEKDEDGQGDGKGDQDGGQGDQNGQQQGGKQGSRDKSGGYDENRPVPKEAIDRNEAQGKGSVSDKKLDEMKQNAKQNLAEDKSNQQSEDQRHIRSGRLEADHYQFDNGEQAVSQREMSSQARGQALPNEQGQLSQMGNQLAMRLKRIKSETRAPERYRRRGKLDSRRYGQALAGNPRVYYKPGVNLDLSLEIDVSIDRSGSVSARETENQYRMAKMFAVASKEADIPMSIYGWDGGWSGNVSHYAYKERHSDDMRGIDAIFQSGGGGTPTEAGVRFARKRLSTSKAKQKVMVVVTDGGANSQDLTRDQVQAAEREGIKVLGMAFGVDAQTMNNQFGEGNWVSIDRYVEAPQIIGELIEREARKAAVLQRR